MPEQQPIPGLAAVLFGALACGPDLLPAAPTGDGGIAEGVRLAREITNQTPPVPPPAAATPPAITPDADPLRMDEGGEAALAVAPPAPADWRSSAPAVVSVEGGVLAAHREGRVTVTARTDGGEAAVDVVSHPRAPDWFDADLWRGAAFGPWADEASTTRIVERPPPIRIRTHHDGKRTMPRRWASWLVEHLPRAVRDLSGQRITAEAAPEPRQASGALWVFQGAPDEPHPCRGDLDGAYQTASVETARCQGERGGARRRSGRPRCGCSPTCSAFGSPTGTGASSAVGTPPGSTTARCATPVCCGAWATGAVSAGADGRWPPRAGRCPNTAAPLSIVVD